MTEANAAQRSTTTVLPVRKELQLPCRPADAFRMFTQEVGQWWPVQTHSVFAERSLGCAIDPRVGGQFYEIGPEDAPTSLPCTLIAGTSAVKLKYWRPDGISATVSPLNVCSVRALVTSTTGGSPVTVIASFTPPTFRSWSTVAMNVPVRTTPSRLTGANPDSVNVTV